MRAYRWSIRLKLGLIVFAVSIAVASLLYTQSLVERLREREQAVIQLWADAQAQVAQVQSQSINPYRSELRALNAYLRTAAESTRASSPLASSPRPETSTSGLSPERAAQFQQAVDWAESMPPTGELNFILNEILEPNPFSIPAIITDSTSRRPLFWRNVSVPDTLHALSPRDSARAMRRLQSTIEDMDASFDPIPIRIAVPTGPGDASTTLTQYVHYEESSLVSELRFFPWVQLLFVSLFIGVGYLSFSYVRRSEQNNLWVGMAREAAHQLGTPISSLMGWVEMLRLPDLPDETKTEAVDEIENDVHRLQRVANRFSDIGSLPKLKPQPIRPVITQTADYIRRRMPSRRDQTTLSVSVSKDLRAPVNEELFAWVVENLLKNALDAMDENGGRIDVTAGRGDDGIWIDVTDTGCGIDRSQWRNVFRPGYSTKKRGWGLGLSLAQRVVEDYHGGSLQLKESTIGEGTTFRIELPPADED